MPRSHSAVPSLDPLSMTMISLETLARSVAMPAS